MTKRVHSLYEWEGQPGDGTLTRVGSISEAKLWAWEYAVEKTVGEAASSNGRDTVRMWTTRRPDLRIPEHLLVGDTEETLDVSC